MTDRQEQCTDIWKQNKKNVFSNFFSLQLSRARTHNKSNRCDWIYVSLVSSWLELVWNFFGFLFWLIFIVFFCLFVVITNMATVRANATGYGGCVSIRYCSTTSIVGPGPVDAWQWSNSLSLWAIWIWWRGGLVARWVVVSTTHCATRPQWKYLSRACWSLPAQKNCKQKSYTSKKHSLWELRQLKTHSTK